MDQTQRIKGIVRSLRRVQVQGSIFGQSVAIRMGLSDSDIDALELLVDSGAATAGRLAEIMGLTSGAVTRVVDRLEQAGYVRRTTDPADRRRVVIEVVPEKIATLEQMMSSLKQAAEDEAGRYTPDQLEAINDFLGRMASLTETETQRMRTTADDPTVVMGPSEQTAPLAGLTAARLMFRSGAQDIRLRAGTNEAELFRGRFDGATPQVRVRDGRVLIQYRGIPFDWRKRAATIALNPTIPWSVELVGGVQRLEADLRRIDLQRLDVTGGSNRLQLELGQPAVEVPIRFVGGASSIRLERPRGVPVRVSVVGGASGVRVDGQAHGGLGGASTITSNGFDRAAGRYVLEVVGGAHDLDVIETP